MSPAAIGAPPMWIGLGVKPPGYDALVPVGNTTRRRRIEPPAHNKPSPKGMPKPPANWPSPWKKRPGPGMSVAVRTSVSVAMLGLPLAVMRAPPVNVEFAQPLPAAPELAHGQ